MVPSQVAFSASYRVPAGGTDPERSAGGVGAVGHAVPIDALEQHVGGAGAALGGEVVEVDRAAGIGDDRRAGVAGVEPHRAVGERDVVGVVDVPAVRGAGADTVRVVVVRVVARHRGAR